MSESILETAVTWPEFESRIRSALGTEARFGTNKSIIDIGEGNGYASRCGLITCDWAGAAEGEKLPARVVLKIPSILPIRKLNDALPDDQKMFASNDELWKIIEGKLNGVHNTEVATYDFFEEFEGLALPKKYYGLQFGEDTVHGQICLEYVENSRMMNFHEKHSVEVVRQIARAIGKMQACSLKREPVAPELQKDFFKEVTNSVTFEAYRGLFKVVLTLDSSDETKTLMDGIDALLPTYFGSNLACSLHKQMGCRPVLVSGDLRTENILIDKDSGDLAALIDWQCTHLGIGAEDLHRVTLFALTAEDRRASMPMLLKEMYESLVENLDGDEPPYSLEKLSLLSDLLYPHCALYYASGVVTLITNLDRDQTLSDEEKAKRREVELDKVIGCLEDILLLDAKNKDHVKDLKFIY